jgi:hypothetical protein
VRRKLEDGGYKDILGLTPNGDGTMSARRRATIAEARCALRRLKVDIDASGRVRER